MIDQPSQELGIIRVETKLRESGFETESHHCHNHCQLLYVENGACSFLIDGNRFDLRAGDFILVPAMSLHNTRYGFGRCKRTVIHFREEDIPDEIQATLPKGAEFLHGTQIFQTPVGHRERIRLCLEQMMSEMKISDERSLPMMRCLLSALLLFCGRVCVLLTDPPADIRSSNQQILKAAKYINEHYMEPINTAEIAQEVGFSPNYLSRKFHSSAGIGLHEYLVFVRLRHAALELVSTHDSITAIALRCGFSDSNYFKDCFKNKFGMTPREYRKST